MPFSAGSRRLVLSALALLGGAAALAEIALRVCEFRYRSAAERDVIWSHARDAQLAAREFYARDAREIWKPLPGAEVPWSKGEHLDASGFRSDPPRPERASGVPRIAILGSSEALGVGLAREHCWPALLHAELETHGLQTEILCAAVEDTTLAQGLERWRAEVRGFAPDLVLCTFAGEMESRAAPCGCSDAQRIADNCGHGFPDYRERPAGIPPFAANTRLVQAGQWLVELLDGDYWSWRTRELEALRLAARQEIPEAGGTRRVPLADLQGLVGQLDQEVTRSGAKLILFPIVGEKFLRGKSPAVGAYQATLLEVAHELQISRLTAWELFEREVAAGVRIEDLVRDGRLDEAAQRVLSRELARVLAPRLKELRR
jgi:hypothetical protein